VLEDVTAFPMPVPPMSGTDAPHIRSWMLGGRGCLRRKRTPTRTRGWWS